MRASILVKLFSFKDILKAIEESSDAYTNYIISNEIKYINIFNKIFKLTKINSCLIKSLSVLLFLKKNNFKPELFIGVLMKNGEFQSHAWLMVGNEILTEKHENFAEFKIINILK